MNSLTPSRSAKASISDAPGDPALKALRVSESRYRRLFEAARDGILLLNADTAQIEDVNPYLIEMLGYTHAEFLGKKLWEVGSFADIAQSREMFAELQTQGYVRYDDLPLKTKSGARIAVEFVSNTYDCEGVTVIQCNIRDITERKKADQKFKDLLDATPDAMVIVNHDGEVAMVNLQALNLFGWRREEMLGKSIEMLMPARFRAKHLGERGGFFAQPRTRPMAAGLDLVGLRKDGTEFPAEISLSPLETTEGRVAIATIRDITERKQAAQELRESERRFSDMLKNVELIAAMLDQDGRITYCNEYLLCLTGWQHEEVIGQDWFDLFIAAESRDPKSVFGEVLANLPEAWHHENEILTRSGERRLIRWNNTVLRSRTGDVIGTASIGEDITEQKRAETRIRRLNRVYSVLSGINALIVRARDRDELFSEACRIAVESGGFRMSLLCIVDQREMKIVPVASAGKDEALLVAVKGILSSPENAPKTMVARAIREKRAVVANDSQRDPQVLFGKLYADAEVGSMAVLPLIVGDVATGVLALYAGEAGFFDEEEMRLLTELAGDIAFALDHIEKAEKLDYLAYYDPLTGLANRSLFLERVAQHLRNAVAGGDKLAVALIDLERFKNINDSLGRPAGDALLRQVAEWLKHITGDTSLLARVGADLFAGLLPQVEQGGDVARLLEKSMDAFLDHPFHLNDSVFRIAAKVGVALFPDDGADADTLFRNAEAALKKAKASGERYLFYTQTMTETVSARLTLENELRRALDNHEFVLHYQPKVNLASGKLVGAEALIRWNDPRTGLVPPGRFIPILEETGLIYDVGQWALRQAVADYLRWRAAGLPAVRIAVNVSPLQLRQRGFIAEVEQAIGIDAQAAAGLELEITESVIMQDVKHNIASLQAIRAMGVSIAIDDFGTGFSSLSYLAKLPVDTLKIDRSFVIDINAGPQGLALVSTIIKLAHSLKLKVVAEGVETEEQRRLLHLLDCDEMQGFLFSKPLPGEIFEAKYLALAAVVPT
jgi:diguanylate cyclase (GGDEF)-like protein/PAS domain S-box-containing protein